MKNLSGIRASFNPFAAVEILLTGASLVLVALTVGNELAERLDLTGGLGTAVAWSIAIVFDALWIGSLRMSELAIRQRNTLGMTVMLTLSAIAILASSAILYVLGHASVFAAAPIAAAAFMGLRIFTTNVLADPVTAASIAKDAAHDRNASAQARSEARLERRSAEREAWTLQAEAYREVVIETASHLAEAKRQAVRAEILTKTQRQIDKAKAKAEKRLTVSAKRDGAKAEAFSKRTLAVLTPSQMELPQAEAETPALPQGETPEVEAETLEAVEGEILTSENTGPGRPKKRTDEEILELARELYEEAEEEPPATASRLRRDLAKHGIHVAYSRAEDLFEQAQFDSLAERAEA
ncbi:hypothetical protein ABT282_30870 [Streptomyces sp. NPDC000927]|uniref:hypothetical protein n=1 Tax=Streptomyces sp. NPDC000927 TaxID=3154371 RepID=UPI0033193E02